MSCSKQCLSSCRVTITLCLSACRSFAWKQNENLSYLRQHHEMAAAAAVTVTHAAVGVAVSAIVWMSCYWIASQRCSFCRSDLLGHSNFPSWRLGASLVWRYRQQIGGQSTKIPCACHLKNTVRLSASLTVPKLFEVQTVHIGTLVSGCVSRTVMLRSGSAAGCRRRLSNVADPCARRIGVAAGFCIEGEMCLL